MYGHVLRLPGGDTRTFESGKRSDRELCAFGRGLWRTQIDLGNLVAGGLPGVFDGEAHVQTAIRRADHFRFRISEAGVRKPVSEWIKGCAVLLVEPAVTHEDSFGIRGLAVHTAANPLWGPGIVGRHLIQA